MKIFREKDKEEIIKLLNENQIFAIKTDTVFGIMAKMSYENEIKINKLKKCDLKKKKSIILESKEYLKKYIKNLTLEKEELIDSKLPGKYTFIVLLDEQFCKERGFDRNDFGVRVTKDNFLQDLIKYTGPLLATSCNIAGFKPCNNVDEIIEQFKNTDLNIVEGVVLDNKSSKIIDIIDEIKVIRE